MFSDETLYLPFFGEKTNRTLTLKRHVAFENGTHLYSEDVFEYYMSNNKQIC